MKKYIIVILLLCAAQYPFAQNTKYDSLKAIINLQNGDTAEVNALVWLSYQQVQIDSAIKYAEQGLTLAKKIKYRNGEADCLLMHAFAYDKSRNYSQIIKYTLGALRIYEEMQNRTGVASAHLSLQGTYREVLDYRNALLHALLGEEVAEANNIIGVFGFPGHRLAPLFLAEIGQTYLLMNQLDSAYLYTQKSINQNELFNGAKWGFPVYLLATIQTMQGKYKDALENYHQALLLHVKDGHFRDTLQTFSGISTLYKKIGKHDSAIHYATTIVQSTNPELETKTLLEAISNLASEYRLIGKSDSALKYIEQLYTLKDSLLGQDKDRDIQNITLNERLNQQQILSDQAKYKSKVQLFLLITGMLILLLIALILWRNNRRKQKDKNQIEHAYNNLKSTQAQLIQSEKMASLGQLTAGIAHEIQNPLNFVNNFSEVNAELLEELMQKIEKGHLDEVKDIAGNLIENEQKINQHGKRADSIVKGMLQHSRSGTVQKEPTDINAMAEEYLRLSYHGFRAKDKNFNATLSTHFDSSIGKINIIPQEIGRVLLNLFNNAFYAVSERQNSGEANYSPTVSVTTKRVKDKIEIHVSDNGGGIPEKIREKIFQPFFTTKPTGQGTGLGLSLSYDIITKGHNGVITLNTKESEFSEFVIQLPIA